MAADEEKPDPQTHEIIGAAMEVHRILGHGFLEMVYQQALAREFTTRCIPFRREVALVIAYKNEPLDCAYKADFICHEEIIVETKAISALSGVDHAQLMNYLKATKLRRGLLLNFGSPRLQVKRMVCDWKS
ncbi:MAG: GxxExxY protein [Planctomycetes bacterium]|nr:GxxExxY protein [Planctomycetota bacterium]NUQ33542.1 GxxExxY protein [Planctomycetaceae bacterium]